MFQKLRDLRFKYGLLWSASLPTLEDLGYSRGKLAKDIVLFLLALAAALIARELSARRAEFAAARARVDSARAGEATAMKALEDCLNARGIPLKDDDGKIRTAVFCDAGKEQKI